MTAPFITHSSSYICLVIEWPSVSAIIPQKKKTLSLGQERGIFTTWSQTPAPTLPQKARYRQLSFLMITYKEMAPSPWERHSGIAKMARDLFSSERDLHTFQRDRERIYNYKFSKEKQRRGHLFLLLNQGKFFFLFSICIYSYEEHPPAPSTQWSCTHPSQRLIWLNSFRGRSGVQGKEWQVGLEEADRSVWAGRRGENQPDPGPLRCAGPVSAICPSQLFLISNCLLSRQSF